MLDKIKEFEDAEQRHLRQMKISKWVVIFMSVAGLICLVAFFWILVVAPWSWHVKSMVALALTYQTLGGAVEKIRAQMKQHQEVYEKGKDAYEQLRSFRVPGWYRDAGLGEVRRQDDDVPEGDGTDAGDRVGSAWGSPSSRQRYTDGGSGPQDG